MSQVSRPATSDQSSADRFQNRELTLHRALVHVIVDIYRHAGHADVVRELIDGKVGADRRWSNLPPGDEAWWTVYWNKVESAAAQAGEAT